MLDIIVNGQRIAIERGTSIQVEFNSSIFSTDGIEGDVAYSFDVPAAPNDLIFESARFVYVQRRRKYACAILLAGTPIGNGNLYVTKATKDTYSCELAVNAFPDGWRDRKLRDNDYGDDIIISDNYAEHRQNWLAFLQSTLDDDSVVKFPLFLDEEYYDDNEDFGYWKGQANKPINDINDFGRRCRFVNRIVYVIANGIRRLNHSPQIDNGSTYPEVSGGPWKIFSEEHTLNNGSIEKNQISLAPAIRLIHLLNNVAKNAGYSLIGDFVNGEDMVSLFYQSLHSMDGNIHDNYIMNDSRCSGAFVEDVSQRGFVNGRTFIPFYATEDPYNLFNGASHSYHISQEGVYHFTFNIQFYATSEEIYAGAVGGNYAYGCCLFVMRDKDNQPVHFPIGCTAGTDNLWHMNVGFESFLAMANGQYMHNYDYYFSPPENWNTGGVCNICIDFTHTFQASDIGKDVVFEFMFVQQICNTPGAATEATIYHAATMRVTADFTVAIDDIAAYNLNIYTNKLVWRNHVPDLTNAEFLNQLKQTFGLSIFINSVTKEMELSYCKNSLHARQLDLSRYNLTEEITIEQGEQKNISYMLTPVQSESYSERKRIADVEYMNQLEPARDNQGKVALVGHLNELFKSSKVETTTGNGWSHTWLRFSGNNTNLRISHNGVSDEIAVKSDAQIPSVEFIVSIPPVDVAYYAGPNDSSTHEITDEERNGFKTIHFPEIAQRCISFINESDPDDGDDGFPLILLRDIGDDTLPPYTDVTFNDTTYVVRNYLFGPLYYHHFSPVCYGNDNARVPGNDLTATGEHSIGEVYVKPWLQLLSNYEKITYRFLLPPAKLLEVIRLFRPQDAAPENQMRWIFVENVRVLPIRMTFEIVEGKDQILTEIECAKPVV